jgi:hypothetical protein
MNENQAIRGRCQSSQDFDAIYWFSDSKEKLFFSRVSHMSLICEVVQHALTTGYLTIAAENQLRQLLQSRYGERDRHAFLKLQEATMLGHVKQESRELVRPSSPLI